MARSPSGAPAPPLRLRQVAAIVADLDEAVAAASAVLDVPVGFRDPESVRYGLVNAILVIGDTFLEVVSPVRGGTTAERFLRRRGPSAGYMVCLQASEETVSATRLAGLGVRVVENLAYEGGRTLHLHPKDVGGAILSLDACRPHSGWHWAGPDWRSGAPEPPSAAIVSVELRGRDHEDLARRWSRVAGRTATKRGGAWIVPLDGGELRFTSAGRGECEGLARLQVAVPDPEAVRVRAAALGLLEADGAVRLCGLGVGLVAGGA